MNENSNDPIFTGIAFLSGITITSLFFVLQNSTLSNNFYLITPLTTSSLLFILATIARLNISNNRIPKSSKFSKAISLMTIAGLYLLLLSLFQIIFKFNPISGVIAFLVLAGCWIILNNLEAKSKPKNQNPES